MKHSIQTKFECQSVTKDKHGLTNVKLEPVFSTTGENRKFWDATPNGQIELTIRNSETAEIFIPGKEYSVTFSTSDIEAENNG
jgi:hypothetical protein